MTNPKKIEITLPVYNEEKILEKNSQKIIEYLEQNYKDQWHITIAENGSTDNTINVAQNICSQNINIDCIATKKGRGNAIKASWQESVADYLIYMDIDLSTQPKEIAKLVTALNKSDIAIGSRFLKSSNTARKLGRRIISKIYNFLVNKILGIKVKDSQCGFKGITQKNKYILKTVNDPHWFFDTELIYNAQKDKLLINEVAISWDERQEQTRKSKVNIIFDSLTFLKNIFKLKFENKLLLPAIIIFTAFSFIIFFIIKDAPGALCPDSFYHAKIAEIIWETKSLIMGFPWLPFTILGGNKYVDHHMIYHIISAPFIGLFGFYGLKIITSILAGGVFATIYIILKKHLIKNPLAWLTIALVTPAFIYRITLFRTMSLSIILLLAGLYFIINKKYLFLFITAFIFVWSYNAFPLLLLLAIFYMMSEKLTYKKIDIKPTMIIIAGILSGIIINPYFPQNLNFYKIHLFIIPFLNGLDINYQVGAEWYPLSVIDAAKGLTIIWLIFCISLAAIIYSRRNRTLLRPETIAAAITSLAFFAASLKSQRFIEYWVPFTIVFSALLFRDLNFDRIFKNFLKKMYEKTYLIQFLAIMVVPLTILSFTIISTQSKNNSTTSYRRLEQSSNWAKANIPINKNIVNISWDTFPELYYWNDKNNYTAGMDLMFLCSHDEKKCDIYNKVIKEKTDLSKESLNELRYAFNTDIIFILKNNETFNSLAENHNLKLIYEDEYASIFRIASNE